MRHSEAESVSVGALYKFFFNLTRKTNANFKTSYVEIVFNKYILTFIHIFNISTNNRELACRIRSATRLILTLLSQFIEGSEEQIIISSTKITVPVQSPVKLSNARTHTSALTPYSEAQFSRGQDKTTKSLSLLRHIKYKGPVSWGHIKNLYS